MFFHLPQSKDFLICWRAIELAPSFNNDQNPSIFLCELSISRAPIGGHRKCFCQTFRPKNQFSCPTLKGGDIMNAGYWVASNCILPRAFLKSSCSIPRWIILQQQVEDENMKLPTSRFGCVLEGHSLCKLIPHQVPTKACLAQHYVALSVWLCGPLQLNRCNHIVIIVKSSSALAWLWWWWCRWSWWSAGQTCPAAQHGC